MRRFLLFHAFPDAMLALGGAGGTLGGERAEGNAAIGNTRRAQQDTQKGLSESSGKKKLALRRTSKGQEVLGLAQDDHMILRWGREMRLVHSHVPGCSLDFKSSFCS